MKRFATRIATIAGILMMAVAGSAGASAPFVDVTQVNNIVLPAAGPIFVTLPSVASIAVTIRHDDPNPGQGDLNAVSAVDLLVKFETEVYRAL